MSGSPCRPRRARAPSPGAARSADRLAARRAAVLGRRDVGGAAAVEARAGTSGAAAGGSSLNGLPSAPVSVSVSGLNESRPASASAVTISGLAMKFIVVAWPSLRRGKLRLYEVTIVLGTPAAACARRHCPMQGPQALASTTCADVLQRLHLAVALDGGAHLLGARRDHQRHRRLEAVRLGLRGDVGGAAHVLVGRVGAAADQGRRDRVDGSRSRVRHLGGELGDRTRPVGRVRSDDVRLERREVELDHAVVVLLRVASTSRRREQVPALSPSGQLAAPVAAGTSPCARQPGTSRWWRRARRPCW